MRFLETDNAAVDLVQPDFVPKLGRVADFLTTNNGGVGFKQADDLGLGWHTLPFDHSLDSLLDELLDPRDERGQALDQLLGLLKGMQGFGLDQQGPLIRIGMIQDRVEIDPTKPTQDQAIPYMPFCVGLTEAVQPFNRQ